MTVNATLTSVAVTPQSATVASGNTQAFSAQALDQFNLAMAAQPTFTWTVSGGGSIDASGLFTAGNTAGGPFTVTATGSGKNGTASVTVTGGTTSSGPLPDPDLSGIDGKTFLTTDQIGMKYGAPVTGFIWSVTLQRGRNGK